MYKSFHYAKNYLNFVVSNKIKNKEDFKMKTNYEETEAMDDAVTTAVATNNTTDIAESTESGKRVSKGWAWAVAHKGFISEVTDPELRSQLAYYRKKDKQLMLIAIQEEVAR